MEKEALALRAVTKLVSTAAKDAVLSVAPEHYPLVKKFSLILAKRVQRGTIDRAVAEQMIVDVAKSPKQLEGKLVLGEGASEACMGMAKDAVENLGDFINGGATEGKDPVTYLRGMAKRAAKKFDQTEDEGLARICALVNGCGALNKGVFNSACAKTMGAAAAL
jgi:hypothetical protein